MEYIEMLRERLRTIMADSELNDEAKAEMVAETVSGPLTGFYWVGSDNSSMLLEHYGTILNNIEAFFRPFVLESCEMFAKEHGVAELTKDQQRAIPPAYDYLQILQGDACDVDMVAPFLSQLPKDVNASAAELCSYLERLANYPDGLIYRCYLAANEAKEMYDKYGKPTPCINCNRSHCAMCC